MTKKAYNPEAYIRYNYPFANIAKEENVRIQAHFDIQKSIDKTKGTILEIGGPSDYGYFFLNGCSFPRRPLITNVDLKGGMKDKFYRNLYSLYIERKFDLRRNSLKAGTVGICLASNLDILIDPPRSSNQKAWDKKMEELKNEDELLRKQPKNLPKLGLRNVLLRQAKDFLEDGGLLILEGIREQELKYALALGFKLRAATVPNDKNNSNVDTTYRSLVLQK